MLTNSWYRHGLGMRTNCWYIIGRLIILFSENVLRVLKKSAAQNGKVLGFGVLRVSKNVMFFFIKKFCRPKGGDFLG